LWPRTEDIDLTMPGAPSVVRSLAPHELPLDMPSILAAPSPAIAFAGAD
jgi:hypothetical protein